MATLEERLKKVQDAIKKRDEKAALQKQRDEAVKKLRALREKKLR